MDFPRNHNIKARCEIYERVNQEFACNEGPGHKGSFFELFPKQKVFTIVLIHYGKPEKPTKTVRSVFPNLTRFGIMKAVHKKQHLFMDKYLETLHA